MTKRKLNIIFCILFPVIFIELKGQTIDTQLRKLSDAPNDSILPQSLTTDLISYKTALQKWKTVSDVNTWIKENFQYEMARAKQLAENSSEREKTSVYSPAELYQIKKGVCIDLSRFAVETINTIDTSRHVQYLMIEFEPITIDNRILKKHWVAIYQGTSGYYILADSKRPGHIAGPYGNVANFIAEYQTFRERQIVSWKVLLSYKKKMKSMKKKQLK